MPRRAKTIDLLRVVDLLQAHITPALCRTVFGAVRTTERQRVWTLEALIRFWTAVVLRAPKALTQALADSLEGRDPTYPRIEASPEAFFQRCRDLRPAFFAEVFQRFTTRLVTAVPPRYAAEVAPARPVRRHRDPRWLAPGGHRPPAQAAVERARGGAAGLPARCLRSGPRAVPAPALLCRRRGQRDDARRSGGDRPRPRHAGPGRSPLRHHRLLRDLGAAALLGGRAAQSATESAQAAAPAQTADPWREARGLAGARRHGSHRPAPAAALHPLAPRGHAHCSPTCSRPRA